MIQNLLGEKPWQLARDYAMMIVGIIVYVVGYTYFLLPYQIISGGVSGISTLVYYSVGIHPNITYFAINVFLLLIAIRVMGWRYFVRTIIATLVISVLIGVLQSHITTITPDGKEHFQMILGEQKFMACVIGALLEGLGLAIVFLSGGSTGGTDIIASSVNKYWDISLGRMMLLIDIIIIASSYFIAQDLGTMVVGYLTMIISMVFLDFIINSARQSVQFIIVSNKHDEIAHQVNEKLDRGVTVLYGEGFYSKEHRNVLLILAKKHESRRIFTLIKNIDPRAFVSMSNVEGVFGEGFDKIKR